MNKYISFNLLFFALCVSCNNDIQKKSDNHFTTWENPCLDRCGSIWLIQNYVDSTATFTFIEFGKNITDGIPFDVPGAVLGRQKNICCFESIIQKYNLNDSVFFEMSKVIHDIDVNKWGVKVTQDADSLETLFNQVREQAKTDQELIDLTADIFINMYQKYK
jgi:hypothetical protein